MRKVKIKVVGRVTHWLREDRSVFSQLDFDGVPNEKGVVRGMYEKIDLDALYEQHFGGGEVVVDSKAEVKEKVIKKVLEEEFVKKVEENVPFVRKRMEGNSLRTQQRRRKELGISRRVGRPEQIDWDSVRVVCLDRYKKGDSVMDICRGVGISVSSFYRVILRGGSNV